MAILISAGHIYAYQYSLSFFITSLKIHYKLQKEDISNKAIAHRISKLNPEDFNEFLHKLDIEDATQPIKDEKELKTMHQDLVKMTNKDK